MLIPDIMILGHPKIMSVPTLLVFKNGEIIDKSIGLIQKQEVKLLFAK